MLRTNGIFNYENRLSSTKYDEIVNLADKELNLYIKINFYFYDRKKLYQRSKEIIKSNPNYKEITSFVKSNFISSVANTNYRKNCILETELEKQIFINNFVFNDVDNFVEKLSTYNLTLSKIEELNSRIIETKQKAKVTKKYEMVSIDFPEIKTICDYYNISSKELIVNRILELYYFRKEKLDCLDIKPKVKSLI